MKNAQSLQLAVTVVPLASLRGRKKNPRTHSPKQLRQIAESIQRFGFVTPILVDGDLTVIAGHGRVEAARQLGMTEVPTIRLDHMSEAEIRAYVIADNRLAELAGWDEEVLAAEFEYLATLNIDIDLSVTGFETAEIDLFLGAAADSASDEEDAAPVLDPSRVPVTQPGDLWELGRHKLLCADAASADSYGELLGRKKAHAVFTDPPYNVPIAGHVCGLGRVKHREFAMASGEMTPAEYARFLTETFRHLVANTIDGSLHYVFIDWRHIADLVVAGRGIYSELKNVAVWVKDNGGMGSLYRSQHELVCVLKNGSAPHVNNVELGRYGRNRTNVWHYPGVNTLREGRMDELASHPTVKPVALVADAILDSTRRGAVVLDCFGGSGTTLIAAERTGRRGYLVEIDPVYVDVTIERFEKLTGTAAVHAATRRTFSETRDERCATVPTEAAHG